MQRRTRKRIGILAASITAAILVTGGVAVVGNDFRFTASTVEIPAASGTLEAVLTRPTGGPVTGVVVMVHGDGAVDATQDGLYAPWFEGAADAGFATLSWSKPGVGGSTGDWLAQSMDDRAAEVEAAIDWARARADVPTERIVLWGASQAGWVLPKVVAARDDLAGVVAVGTAIDWLSQGRYNLESELAHDDASPAERTRAIAESDATRALLDEGASFEQYLAATTDGEPMSRQRWAFVLRNHGADATDDLRAAAARHLPVLLLAGRHDRNVDVAETERVYREILGDDLSVRHVDAAHSMARPIVEDVDPVGAAVAVLWPRGLLADGVIDGYTDFLRAAQG